MIGRYAEDGRIAGVGRARAAAVASAGVLLLGAAAASALSWPPLAIVALSLASLSFTGIPIILRAARGLARLHSNVDELVSLAILASCLLGDWVPAAVIAFIMVVGATLEEAISARSRRHIEALYASSPRHALLLDADGGASEVAVTSLRAGQRILVRPGDVIAADGVVESGESDVDESLLTGESAGVDKAAGDAVFGGTVNGAGALEVRVARVGEESAHAKVVRLVQEAERHRAPILRVAESYARWFTPAILLLAGLVWIASGDVQRAVTTLIVGCPCAFVLATPTAVVAALSRAARQGLLIKGGLYLEGCSRVDTVAFDKTGTLTTGQCLVTDIVTSNGSTRSEILAAAAALEAGAEHPLARAVLARAREEGVEVPERPAIERAAGLGIVERVEAGVDAWRIGNARLMSRHGVDIGTLERDAACLRNRGFSVVYVARGARAAGLLSVEDGLREEASRVVERLRLDGIADVRLLTGDAEAVARKVGRAIGLPPDRIRSELLPEQKYEHILTLERSGRRVCYVGDGTNDGPALSLATVGVSLGSREHTVALETASVVLMRGTLHELPFLFRLGKATRRVINQNLFVFGLFFNASMLALSGAGILTPVLGALAHNAGSVAVVLNSARLLLFERGPQERGEPGSPPFEHPV